MDARYGLGLLKQALTAAMNAGQLKRQDVTVLTHLLLGALTEAAMFIARSATPAKSQKAAELAVAQLISAWKVEV